MSPDGQENMMNDLTVASDDGRRSVRLENWTEAGYYGPKQCLHNGIYK